MQSNRRIKKRREKYFCLKETFFPILKRFFFETEEKFFKIRWKKRVDFPKRQYTFFSFGFKKISLENNKKTLDFEKKVSARKFLSRVKNSLI
jgi:hypothetical protein